MNRQYFRENYQLLKMGILVWSAFLLAGCNEQSRAPIETDKPFPFKSFMLDVSRNFFDVTTVKQLIDTLDVQGFNYFHWHLSDDQGWRIQLDNYPELTEKASNGQFYTKSDIKEVVDYAQAKGIEVIPEVDIPGHASSLIVAYPQLGLGHKAKLKKGAVLPFNIYMPTNENQKLLEGIITGVADLFPGKYFHLGGDEVLKLRWKRSKAVKQYMQEHYIEDHNALHNYILEEMAQLLKAKGKEAIVWGDMVMNEPLNKDIIIMNWFDSENGIKALKNGHKVIRTIKDHVYFDYMQYEEDESPIPFVFPKLPYEKVISYDIYMDTEELTDEQRKNIIGGGGCLWTEFVTTEDKLWYQVSPRIQALGHVLNSTYRY